jgi:hypothetical protein
MVVEANPGLSDIPRIPSQSAAIFRFGKARRNEIRSPPIR